MFSGGLDSILAARIMRDEGFEVTALHFYTGFNRYYYEKHLTENGFKIVELQENGNFFEYLAQEIRCIPYVAENYAGSKCTRFESLAIKICLSMLEGFSKKDTGSCELLHFGCHVLCEKK